MYKTLELQGVKKYSLINCIVIDYFSSTCYYFLPDTVTTEEARKVGHIVFFELPENNYRLFCAVTENLVLIKPLY